MSGRLQDKVTLVFGAGSSGPGWGNGKAVAALLAREGARAIAADINHDAADETAAIIRDEGGIAVPIAADVTNSADVLAAIQAALTQFGRIDVLHNNVGAIDMAELTAISDERWRHGLDINFTGAFLACHEVVPIMVRQRAGAIVNVTASVATPTTAPTSSDTASPPSFSDPVRPCQRSASCCDTRAMTLRASMQRWMSRDSAH